MSVTKIAYRYGKSLMDLAQDQGSLEQVVEDISLLQSALDNRDLQNLIDSPIVKSDKKQAIFKEIFGDKVSDLTQKYFQIIIAKGRESFLPSIAQSFIDQYKKLQNTSTVKLITAQPLEESTLREIKEKLASSSVTDQKVEMQVEVDPELIGGFVIDLDEMQYDGSIKKKLADLKQSFGS